MARPIALEMRVINIEPKRQDWQRIIAEIKTAHEAVYGRRLTNYKLGEMVGLDHSQVEWLETHSGAEPRYYAGARLLLVLASYELRDRSHIPAPALST
jgi:hypothetical protein